MTSSCNCAFTINGVDSDIVFFLSTETNSAPFLADLFLCSGNTAKQDTTKAIKFGITFRRVWKFRRGSTIDTDRFSERAPKARASRACCPWNLFDFNSLKSSFPGFWIIQTGFWPVSFSSDEALQIAGSFHLSDSTWKSFLYLKCVIFLKLLWKIWPISVKLWKTVWIRAWNYISTIYPASELELKDTSTSTTEMCYLDARIKLGDNNSPSNVSIYDSTHSRF